jgi:ATP-dependent protease ClpP protease subunit
MQTPPQALAQPHIRLFGEVEAAMLQSFFDQLEKAADADPLVVELTTYGGDAEFGRRLALELRILQTAKRREVLVLGKTTVWSAGVTILAAVPAERRWLTDDTLLMIHGRKINRTLELQGSLRAAEIAARRLLAEVEASMVVEEQGFRDLLEGCDFSLDELRKRARDDWYLTASEAVELGFAAGVWGPQVEPHR